LAKLQVIGRDGRVVRRRLHSGGILAFSSGETDIRKIADLRAMVYETFEHTADLGLRVRAADLNALFADAARGLFSMIAAGLDPIRATEELHFEITAGAIDLLLFDWLNELLYAYESRRTLFSRFDVHVSDNRLKAVAYGEPIDAARHALEHEVKAITYHGLKVERVGDGWLAEIIVDI
jgi:SHS2 domain-containing protein